MLTLLILFLWSGGRVQASSKVEQAKHYVHKSRTALRWITTHKRLYRNSRVYHSTIVTWRVNLEYWEKQLAKLTYTLPPHYSAWLCIHSYEGSWRDPNPPYYGGLQMDWAFMSTYGHKLLQSKGPANNWTPLEQMWVAEKAYSSGRGFYPWPNTARMCGLL